MSISPQLCEALDKSTAVVNDAEKFLRKQPGRQRVELDVSRVFDEPEGFFLSFIDDQLIVISRHQGFNVEGDIGAFDIPTRLELTKRIPEFITLVRHAESKILDEFQSAITLIQSAIDGNSPKQTIRVRTDDDLLSVLAEQASRSWVVGKGMENKISKVEIVNFDGTQRVEGDFDRSSERESNGRLVVRFTNGRVVNCQVDFERAQNPVSYPA